MRAGLAVLEKRADEVSELWYAPGLRGELGEMLRWATGRRILCREASERELEKLVGTSNHEGLVVSAQPRSWLTPNELADELVARQGTAIALDRVRNPYNIGAILRSAAFFGVDAALLGAPAPHPALAPDAVRVAEGGAEQLRLSRTTDLVATLTRLRSRGVTVVGAESDGAVDVSVYNFRRPVMLVMGNEREGLGERVRAQCDALVAISGTGAVESLNVAVAAGVMISELTRGRHAAGGQS